MDPTGTPAKSPTDGPSHTARFVDLSLPLEDDRRWAPWWASTKVRYQSHRFGALAARWLFGVPARLLETGLGWANENIRLSTHGTTHVDAPWHYGPQTAGTTSRTIDQMPLSWFCGPGVVLNMRAEGKRDEPITEERVREALHVIDHELVPGDIVLIHTGADQWWGDPAYFQRGATMSAAATEYLIDQGVRLMGIDAWGWDGPLAAQAQRARQANRAGVFWAAHYVGTRREYCQIERLANLDQLPSRGFHVYAFPLKVKGGSAGPARVVAILDQQSSDA